jgi:sugar phosphate isomerase/epimerase
MYRVGYRTASFDAAHDLGTALALIGRAGCDCVEVCLERPDLAPASLTRDAAIAVLDLAAAAGLSVHSLSFHGDGLPWPERAASQRAAVRAARWFAVGVVVVNTPRADEGVGWPALVEHFRALALEGVSAGVAVAIEPEPLLEVADLADMLRLLDDVDCRGLAANLDVGHAFLTEDDLPASIAALAGRLAHVHFEDMPVGEHRHRIPGEGAMDLVGVTIALWAAGFRGPLTIDLFGPFDDPAAVARQATAATRRVVREVMGHVRDGGPATL